MEQQTKDILSEIGINIGFLVAGMALFIVTIIVYFALKKKSNSKYKVEVGTVIVSVLINLVVKTVVICFSEGNNTYFAALYESVGNFAFEGLSLENNLTGLDYMLLSCAYVCASLYAGSVFVAIITFKSSYEIASRAATVWKRSRHSKGDVYIITALNEDALELAKSIKDKCGKNCLICFCGEEIPVFDKKNKLCREIMSEGYYYWSSSTALDKSLVSLLNIKITKDRECVVLAFSKNSNNIPNENNNFNLVKKDIEIRIKNKENYHIDYRVLSGENTSYEIYDRMRRELLCFDYKNSKQYFEKKLKFLPYDSSDVESYIMMSDNKRNVYTSTFEYFFIDGKFGDIDEVVSEIEKHLNQFADINIWNEYVENARQIIDKILKNSQIFESLKYKNGDINIWALGFGKLNQEITKQLFSQLSYLNFDKTESYKTVGYTVRAFDKNMDDIAGVYGENHPLCPYVEVTKKGLSYDILLQHRYMEIAIEKKKSKYKKYAGIEEDNELSKEIEFPKYYFEKVSCLDSDFYRNIDNVTGFDSNENSPDVILISLGDDYNNIMLANTIIRDICLENKSNKRYRFHQTMVVNIKDKKNIYMMESVNSVWKNNVLKLENLTVIITGNNLYTFDNVINLKRAKDYNSTWSSLRKKAYSSGNNNDYFNTHIILNFLTAKRIKCKNAMALKILDSINYQADIVDIRKTLNTIKLGPQEFTAKELINSINEELECCEVGYVKYNNQKEWNMLSAWEKELCKRAVLFYDNNMHKIANSYEQITVKKASELCRIENYRNIRNLISEGFVPTGNDNYIDIVKDQLLKRDDYLKPLEELTERQIRSQFLWVQLSLENFYIVENSHFIKDVVIMFIQKNSLSLKDIIQEKGVPYETAREVIKELIKYNFIVERDEDEYEITHDPQMITSIRERFHDLLLPHSYDDLKNYAEFIFDDELLETIRVNTDYFNVYVVFDNNIDLIKLLIDKRIVILGNENGDASYFSIAYEELKIMKDRYVDEHSNDDVEVIITVNSDATRTIIKRNSNPIEILRHIDIPEVDLLKSDFYYFDNGKKKYLSWDISLDKQMPIARLNEKSVQIHLQYSPYMNKEAKLEFVRDMHSLQYDILCGCYPQSVVRDSAVMNELNKLVHENPTEPNSSWVPYGCINGLYNGIDCKNDVYMWYKDVVYLNNKYRCVYFPLDNPSQSYCVNDIIWFKFEPIKWKILKQAGKKGLVVSSYILDIQAFHKGEPISDWNSSSLKNWLENDFINEAFANSDIDKGTVSLFSRDDVEDGFLAKDYTDYSFWINSDSLEWRKSYDELLKATTGSWWLRSTDLENIGKADAVNDSGFIDHFNMGEANIGIVPILRIEFD